MTEINEQQPETTEDTDQDDTEGHYHQRMHDDAEQGESEQGDNAGPNVRY